MKYSSKFFINKNKKSVELKPTLGSTGILMNNWNRPRHIKWREFYSFFVHFVKLPVSQVAKMISLRFMLIYTSNITI